MNEPIILPAILLILILLVLVILIVIAVTNSKITAITNDGNERKDKNLIRSVDTLERDKDIN